MEWLIIPYAARGIIETFKIIIAVISLLMYIFDFSSDIVTDVLHFVHGDVIWGCLTLWFIIWPIGVALYSLQLMLKHQNTYYWHMNLLERLLFLIIAFPVSPLLLLVWDIVISVRRQPIDRKWERTVIGLKFADAFFESYPQGTLQLYIVFQALAVGDAIGAFQWVSITLSFLALAFAISTNPMFEKAAGSSKAAFFCVGVLGTVSRVVVCCTFSMIEAGYFFATFGAGVIVSAVVTIILHYCCNANQVPQDFSSFHYIRNSLYSALYDSFTIGGFIASILNLGLSIGSFFLPVPQEIAIVAVTLATLTAAANITIIATPCFRIIGKDWNTAFVDLASWSNGN